MRILLFLEVFELCLSSVINGREEGEPSGKEEANGERDRGKETYVFEDIHVLEFQHGCLCESAPLIPVTTL